MPNGNGECGTLNVECRRKSGKSEIHAMGAENRDFDIQNSASIFDVLITFDLQHLKWLAK